MSAANARYGSPTLFRDVLRGNRLADRWLLLGAHGPQARFHMAAAWIALAGLVSVDAVWLSLSRLSFAASNWDSIIRLVLFSAIAFGFCGLVSYRLADETG